jgi:TPR repeat protein
VNLADAGDRYLKAAEQGHAVAQYNLGLIFAKGLTGKPELNQALVWLRAAEKSGYAQATAEIAKIEQQLKSGT